MGKAMSRILCQGENRSNCNHGDAVQLGVHGQCKDLALAQELAQEKGCGTQARSVPEIPEDLIERIIARMPFPSLFKARCLSKSWNLKLSSPSSSLESSSLSIATSFQKQIASVSWKWPTYCLSYVIQDGIYAFDKNSRKWRVVLSLSYFPMESSTWDFVSHCGPLICIALGSEDSFNVFVINAITKCWKKLPCCLSPNFLYPNLVRIIPGGVDGYRVLFVYDGDVYDHSDRVYTHVYDSKLETWTVKESRLLVKESGRLQVKWELEFYNDYGNIVNEYVNGKAFCSCYDADDDTPKILVYDVVENSWIAMLHVDSFGITDDVNEIVRWAVLRCGNRVMLALQVQTRDPNPNKFVYSIRIYELIENPAGCIRVEEVHASPLTGIRPWGASSQWCKLEFASDADFLYFSQSILWPPPQLEDVVLAFNVHSHEWSTLPQDPLRYSSDSMKRIYVYFESAGFEPGLNPFVAV